MGPGSLLPVDAFSFDFDQVRLSESRRLDFIICVYRNTVTMPRTLRTPAPFATHPQEEGR